MQSCAPTRTYSWSALKWPGSLFATTARSVRMQRNACRVLAFFALRALAEAALPDADSIHGRVIDNKMPLMRMIIEHIASLNQNMAGMSASEAVRAFRASIHLLIAAFGKQARGSACSYVQSHIQSNLYKQISLPRAC